MTFFRKFFESKEDRMLKSAEALLLISNEFSRQLLEPIYQKFPQLVEQIEPKNKIKKYNEASKWDITITAACIFIAKSKASDILHNNPSKELVQNIIEQSMITWQKESIFMLNDLENFYWDDLNGKSMKEYDSQLSPADSLGRWVMKTLTDHYPNSQEEYSMGRVIGITIIESFSKYWIK